MDKKFVVPGDQIGTEEEYIPGPGTISESEQIVATIAGDVNDADRTLSVRQKRPLSSLVTGTTIIGVVANVVEPIALISIHEGSGHHRFGEYPDNAVLHASMIKRGYVKNVRDEYKIGDIVRAKIADVRNGEIRLATDSDELGAIKAFCAKCRHAMKLEANLLECESCGAKDNRKIAKDYRNVSLD
jgi:exosome complex component CSL4